LLREFFTIDNREIKVSNDVWVELRRKLDQYSVGFPATESGVEMEILKELFSETEAEMFLNMGTRGETSADVAKRLDLDPGRTEELLDRMADKGLLFRLRKGNVALYSAIPYVVGIYEYQVRNMDKKRARLFDKYMEEKLAERIAEYTVPLRPIAVNRSLNVSRPVSTYEDAREIIKSQDKIAVARCICRLEKGHIGKGCEKPLEVCLSFGPHAKYCVDIGMSRWIGQEEALKIMDKSDEAGLVPMPTNSQTPVGICNCCGDCCGVLTSIKKRPRPVEGILSNFHAVVDEDLCMACEICTERCQMEAIRIGPGDTAQIDLDRCIGCGLCVTTCPDGAISLESRPESERSVPPVKYRDAVMEIMRHRGIV
jgi:H+/Na+-translocating ferredoxin:NAD+ oxidoreductase subunit B